MSFPARLRQAVRDFRQADAEHTTACTRRVGMGEAIYLRGMALDAIARLLQDPAAGEWADRQRLEAAPVAVRRAKNGRRTKAEVLASREGPGGCCCNDYADMKGCDCMRMAVGSCPFCDDGGYEVHPENGLVKGVRCRLGCRVICSICRDPNCYNPGGQH